MPELQLPLDRRGFGRVAAAGGLALALPAGGLHAASPTGPRNPLIGRLSEGGAGDNSVFLGALRDLGYPEVRIEERYARGDMSKLPGLAAELVAMGVGVIWSNGSMASGAAKRATSVIPIVIVSADALGNGLVDNLARPGGNITGLTLIGSDLAAKRIELMRRLLPRLGRVVALTHGPDSLTLPFVTDWNRASKTAADALRIDYLFHELSPDPSTWDEALKSLAARPGTALIFVESPYFLQNRDLLATLTQRHRLPAMFPLQEHVRAGALCSYGVTVKYIHQRSAWYVARILGGAKPGALPVELPTRYELAIHRGTAAALGLTIPRSLLQQADLLVD